MSINIRPFTSEDLPSLMQVWEAANKQAHPFLKTAMVDFARKAIPEQFLPVADTWVAEDDDRIVGFMSLLSHESGAQEVGGMFVHPNCHRKGIGTRLMNKAIELKSSVMLEVFEKNTTGRAFYEAYGFVNQSQNLHELSGEQVIVMTFGA